MKKGVEITLSVGTIGLIWDVFFIIPLCHILDEARSRVEFSGEVACPAVYGDFIHSLGMHTWPVRATTFDAVILLTFYICPAGNF